MCMQLLLLCQMSVAAAAAAAAAAALVPHSWSYTTITTSTTMPMCACYARYVLLLLLLQRRPAEAHTQSLWLCRARELCAQTKAVTTAPAHKLLLQAQAEDCGSAGGWAVRRRRRSTASERASQPASQPARLPACLQSPKALRPANCCRRNAHCSAGVGGLRARARFCC